MREHLTESATAIRSLDPAGYTGASSGAAVDTRGYEGGLAVIAVGIFTPTSIDVVLQESDDNSTWVSIPGAKLTLTSADASKVHTLDAQQGQRTGKRYLRGRVENWNGTGTVLASIAIVLYGAEKRPVAQTGKHAAV